VCAMSDGLSVSDARPTVPTVLLGVTGCIAAYKACELLRLLQRAAVVPGAVVAGAAAPAAVHPRVKVLMTEHAAEFVGPATFRALSDEPVAVGLFDAPGAPIHHISLAKEAAICVVAPCTANVLNKLAAGVADDLLTDHDRPGAAVRGAAGGGAGHEHADVAGRSHAAGAARAGGTRRRGA